MEMLHGDRHRGEDSISANQGTTEVTSKPLAACLKAFKGTTCYCPALGSPASLGEASWVGAFAMEGLAKYHRADGQEVQWGSLKASANQGLPFKSNEHLLLIGVGTLISLSASGTRSASAPKAP